MNVAGHQIALNFSSLMFVLPLSLGVATTIRVGYRLGQGSTEQARVRLDRAGRGREYGRAYGDLYGDLPPSHCAAL